MGSCPQGTVIIPQTQIIYRKGIELQCTICYTVAEIGERQAA